METAQIAILLTALSVVAAAQEEQSNRNKASSGNQPGSGTICVLPNSPELPARISPRKEYNPARLSVKIEKLEQIFGRTNAQSGLRIWLSTSAIS
jgi:hypothetical protein